MINSNSDNENEETEILIDSSYLTNLTEGAIDYYSSAVKEYAERLKREAQSIENMEHTGQGPPEITAAHVEEAKWISLRRMRLNTSSTKWNIFLRFGQLGSSIFVGIGASSFDETWGALLCVGGVLFGSLFLIVERELTREI